MSLPIIKALIKKHELFKIEEVIDYLSAETLYCRTDYEPYLPKLIWEVQKEIKEESITPEQRAAARKAAFNEKQRAKDRIRKAKKK